MPIFDQFDIENVNSFESSSIDRVFFGNLPFNSPPSQTGDPRYNIGGKLEGLNLSVFEEFFVPYWIRSGFQTGSFIGSINRNVSVFDGEEYASDSFVPHPASIMKVNAAIPALFTTASTTPYGGERWGVRALGGTGFELALSTNPADNEGANPIFEGVDCVWHDHFPYQTSYKNLQKTLRQDASLAQGELLEIDSSGAPVSPPQRAGFLARLVIFAESNTIVGSVPIFLCSMMTSNTSSITWKERELGSPTWSDLSKTFYGTGDGGKVSNRNGASTGNQLTSRIDIGRYQPTFGFQYKPGSSATATAHYLSIPIIRGFKYGILNTLAEPLAAKFSRNHFGFMRDMLEQRSGYATTNRNTGASIYAPVSVTFVSGTTSFQRAVWYASSSTTTDFNPRDSGIYDSRCRVGQPFFDG